MATKKKVASKKPAPKTKAATPATDVQVIYEETGALFADEVIVNAGKGRVLLDFSSGIISDAETGRRTLPVQKRIALTPQNAVNLIRTLTAVMQQAEATKNGDDKKAS